MSDSLIRCFKQVVVAQLLLAVSCAVIVMLWFSLEHGYSILFGATLALANTLISKRSMQKAGEIAYKQPDLSMLPVYFGLMQRLIVFSAGFAVGVVGLGLMPLPVIAGFAVLQLGYLACKMR